jgi:hypothetical protein
MPCPHSGLRRHQGKEPGDGAIPEFLDAPEPQSSCDQLVEQLRQGDMAYPDLGPNALTIRGPVKVPRLSR